jgi:hypothetical protein
MERKKTLFLVCLIICALGSAVIWLGSHSSVRGQISAAPTRNGSIAQKRLGIQIGLSKPFTVPAAKPGRILETFLRVPTGAASENKVASFSAIKLTPNMVGNKIEVRVSVMSGDTSLIKSCNDWGMLKESAVTSYTLGEGEEATVSRLSNLGPNFKNGMLTFRAVPFEIAPEETDCGCGRCGDLYCCPNSGACLGCGVCGDVCCRIKQAD